MTSPQENDDLRMLEFVYDDGGVAGPAPGDRAFEVVGGEEVGHRTAARLRSFGLIEDDQSLVIGTTSLVKAGRTSRLFGLVGVSPASDARPVAPRCWPRSTTCYPGLTIPSRLSTSRWCVDGMAYSDDEIHNAIEYLIAQGLLRSWQQNAGGEHTLVSLTSAGSECAESGTFDRRLPRARPWRFGTAGHPHGRREQHLRQRDRSALIRHRERHQLQCRRGEAYRAGGSRAVPAPSSTYLQRLSRPSR